MLRRARAILPHAIVYSQRSRLDQRHCLALPEISFKRYSRHAVRLHSRIAESEPTRTAARRAIAAWPKDLARADVETVIGSSGPCASSYPLWRFRGSRSVEDVAMSLGATACCARDCRRIDEAPRAKNSGRLKTPAMSAHQCDVSTQPRHPRLLRSPGVPRPSSSGSRTRSRR